VITCIENTEVVYYVAVFISYTQFQRHVVIGLGQQIVSSMLYLNTVCSILRLPTGNYSTSCKTNTRNV